MRTHSDIVSIAAGEARERTTDDDQLRDGARPFERGCLNERATMRTKDSKAVSLRLRFADHARLGPGKMALLQAVQQTGSIATAGRAMNMSYRRAWLLIDSVNAMFEEPVVLITGADAAEGRSALTPLGEALLAAYRATEADTEHAVARHFAALLPRLRSEPAEPRSPPD